MADKKHLSALAGALGAIKAEAKAETSPSATLQWIIDDYCSSGQFDNYVADHKDRAALYLPDRQYRRGTRWRASSAGRCPQQQAYEVMIAELTDNHLLRGIVDVELIPAVVKEKPFHARALYNGTFTHLRYHLLFDALHDLGLVETLTYEECHLDFGYNLSGTVDRIIRFDWNGKVIRAALDFKTIKSVYFKDLGGPKPEHVKQVHDYFLLNFESDCFMVLYEDKDTQRLKIYDAQYDELVLQALRNTYGRMGKWLTQVYEGVPPGERVKLPLITDWCAYCPYINLCDVDNPDRAEPGTDDTEKEVVW